MKKETELEVINKKAVYLVRQARILQLEIALSVPIELVKKEILLNKFFRFSTNSCRITSGCSIVDIWDLRNSLGPIEF